jgi:UDP-N-acetylmuramate dehydrogenase
MANILKELSGAKKNVPLKNYTTYKIGGPAKYFFIAKTKEDLIEALRTAKNLKLPIFILGGGSNLLVSDRGFNGLVIKINIHDINFRHNEVLVGAGADLTKLAHFSAENGLSGLEWAAGVPGTIGGAVYGNAQAFGTKISDAVKTVEAINLKTLKIKNFTKKQCRFSLKNSIFKESNTPRGTRNLIIISATLKLNNGKKEEINEKIKEYMQYRKKNHPMNFPSAGSVFVNPEKNGEIIRAGFLIEKCGLAGKKIGKAQISEKHANFIINLGGAKSKDVLSLINLAKKKVKNKFGIELEPEVQFLGF